MLGGQAEGFQKFDLQDKVVNDLRNLATSKGVHIMLIIHPKKVEDDTNLNVASIFGSAKSTQEADTVMILQKPEVPNLRTVQVKKNRYDGDVGQQHLAFCPDNKRYFEISDFEYQTFFTPDRRVTIQSLIAHRKNKFDGEIEPQLLDLAASNPRANLQNFQYRGSANKLQEMLERDFELAEEKGSRALDVHRSIVSQVTRERER